jgi:hypothetical protein
VDRRKASSSVGPPLARGQTLRSEGHPVFFRHMDHFTCHQVVRISVRTPLRTFLRKGLAHAQTMCTGHFLLPLKGPGNEARNKSCMVSNIKTSHEFHLGANRTPFVGGGDC